MNRIMINPPPSVNSRLAFVSILGLAPLCLMATRFDLAVGFSLIAWAVVLFTQIVLYLLRPLIRDDWFLAWAAIIGGFWVAVAQQLLRLFHPALLQNIEFYLAILSVSPLALVQMQFILNQKILGSVLGESGRIMGIFFVLMSGTGLIRELLGNGSLTLIPGSNQFRIVVPGLSEYPLTFLAGAGGGMILLGFIVAFAQWLKIRRQPEISQKPETDEGGSL